jgi:mono/diheme cytochrome c family protein
MPLPKFVKAALAAVLLLMALIAVAGSVRVVLGERKRARSVEVKVVPVAFVKDAAALKQGRYLYESRGCSECHGADGQGKVVIDGSNGFHVRSPDITSGGAGGRYTEADWVRAIRHGVSPGGHALLVMPSEDYNRMTDGDLAALVAYMRSLPPGPGKPAEIRMPWIVKALYGAGQIPDAAEKIDHRLPPAQPVPVGATVEHGAYVAQLCKGCHGETYSGGKIPGAPPEWPAASNLTPGEGTVMTRYDTLEKFAAMLRTGKRPDGSAVDRAMPFETLKALNDVDVEALHGFLTTLPPRTYGRR